MMSKIILFWKEVEMLTRVNNEGNHINLDTACLKGCGNSMALLIEWLELGYSTYDLPQ